VPSQKSRRKATPIPAAVHHVELGQVEGFAAKSKARRTPEQNKAEQRIEDRDGVGDEVRDDRRNGVWPRPEMAAIP
jgi:hypothetical protein